MRSDTVPTHNRKLDILDYHPPGPQLSGQIDQSVYVATVNGASSMHASNIVICERHKGLWTVVSAWNSRTTDRFMVVYVPVFNV